MPQGSDTDQSACFNPPEYAEDIWIAGTKPSPTLWEGVAEGRVRANVNLHALVKRQPRSPALSPKNREEGEGMRPEMDAPVCRRILPPT